MYLHTKFHTLCKASFQLRAIKFDLPSQDNSTQTLDQFRKGSKLFISYIRLIIIFYFYNVILILFNNTHNDSFFLFKLNGRM